MNRRGFLGLTGAIAGTGGVLPGPVTAESPRGDRVSTRCAAEIRRTDWVPHYTVDIERDGRATVEIAVDGDDVPGEIGLGLESSGEPETIRGGDALREREGGLLWTPSIADTIVHEVTLGTYRSGNVVTEVSDGAVFTVVNELPAPTGWEGGIEALPDVHRFTIDPPNGWTVAFPGNQVGPKTYEVNPRVPLDQYPREVIAVGDFDVHTRDVGGTELRAVELPRASGVDPVAALDLWADVLPHYEYYYQDAAFPKLGVVVPTPEGRRGGQARDHSFVVTDNLPLLERGTRTLSTVAAELGRTFQRHDRPRWYLDGTNNWINQLLVLYEAGRVSEAELREHVQIAGTEGGGAVGAPYEIPLEELDDARWMVLPALAALDVDVRARTGGDADFSDLLARTHDPRACGSYTVERETLLTALVDTTGIEYSEFFERFVDGPGYPDVVLTDAFSISDPVPVDFGPALAYTSTDVAPRRVHPGQRVTATGTLENVGSAEWASTVQFRVDGTSVGTRDVTLAAGETTTVDFEYAFEEAGTHELALDRYELGDVSVRADSTATEADTEDPSTEPNEDAPPNRSTTDDTPGFGVLEVLGGLGGAASLLFRRLSDCDEET